jgi:hypothetical protein
VINKTKDKKYTIISIDMEKYQEKIQNPITIITKLSTK